MSIIWKKIKDYGILVMFSHTIFSLSFAAIAMFIASEGLPSLATTFWIIVAFLSARTGANAINRVIDAEIDAKNPRTANRQLPKGLMNKREVIVFSIICFAIMVFAAIMINPLCLILSPIALFLMVLYPYTKRFTWACHLVLGITSALAPIGAWIAVKGEIGLIPLIMGLANTLWVAGFDIIYGAQDYDFDTKNSIHSIPARFGIEKGLNIAAGFHLTTIILLIIVGTLTDQLSTLYYVGVGIVAILLMIEHKIISPDNLTNAKIASYNINQVVSIVLLLFGTMAVFI